jgi:hypothetical protein
MYCVCVDKKTGELSIQTRIERERTIDCLIDIQADIPTYVLKTFDLKEWAEKYIDDMINADKILNKIL